MSGFVAVYHLYFLDKLWVVLSEEWVLVGKHTLGQECMEDTFEAPTIEATHKGCQLASIKVLVKQVCLCRIGIKGKGFSSSLPVEHLRSNPLVQVLHQLVGEPDSSSAEDDTTRLLRG